MTPETFTVKFKTTRGEFTVTAHADWAPRGAERFHELVTSGFFTDVAFFRVLDGCVAQFGISGDPESSARWRSTIQDDPVVGTNSAGTLSFAMAGPDTPSPRSNVRRWFNGFPTPVDGLALVRGETVGLPWKARAVGPWPRILYL